MAKMMGRNYKKIPGMAWQVRCPCCPGPLQFGRAAEKREWRLQLAEDIGESRWIESDL